MSEYVNFRIFNENFLDINASVKASYSISDTRYAVVEEPINAEIFIPLSTFRKKSCGKTLVSYLKSKGLSFSDIARILNRDPRTIWTLYKKAPEESYFDDNDMLIPVEIFSYRGFSILESLIFWLKTEKGMDYVQISKSLGKNYQTIRTVYFRALKKIEGSTINE